MATVWIVNKWDGQIPLSMDFTNGAWHAVKYHNTTMVQGYNIIVAFFSLNSWLVFFLLFVVSSNRVSMLPSFDTKLTDWVLFQSWGLHCQRNKMPCCIYKWSSPCIVSDVQLNTKAMHFFLPTNCSTVAPCEGKETQLLRVQCSQSHSFFFFFFFLLH